MGRTSHCTYSQSMGTSPPVGCSWVLLCQETVEAQSSAETKKSNIRKALNQKWGGEEQIKKLQRQLSLGCVLPGVLMPLPYSMN